MPVQVDPALRERLQDDIDVTFVVRAPDLDGLDAAMSAVVRAVWDLHPLEWPDPEETPSPSDVSHPVRIPGGRLVTVDFHDVPADYRTRLPETLTAVLSGYGITDARLEAPALLGDRYLDLDRFIPLVRTWLHDPLPAGAPRFTARPSDALVDAALAWLSEVHQQQSHLVAVAGGGVAIPLSWSDHRPIVDDMLTSPSDGPTRVLLLSTDFADHAHAVELGALNGYGILLTSGQRDSTHEEIAEQLLRRRDLVRGFPGRLEWAGVMLDHTAVTGRFLASPHQRIGPDHPAVPLWYQLFSPAQIERLGRTPEGAVQGSDGGTELTIGEPEHWIRGTPEYDGVVRRAQELLTPPRRPGIRIGQRLTRTAARSRTLVFTVRSEPAQPEAVRAAVRGLRTTEPAPGYVSDPIPGPDGPLVVVDVADLSAPARRELPDRIRAELEAASVTDADLDTPAEARPQPYLDLARCRPAVRAWLHTREPVVPLRRASALVDATLAWLRDQHQVGDRLLGLVESVEIPLAWDDHRPVIDALLRRTHDQQDWTILVQSDFDSHAAYLYVGFASGRGILLTSAALNWSDADLAGQLANLRQLVDRHATELEHAGVALDPIERHFLLPHAALHDPAQHVPPWYRLLSPAQLDRLGADLPAEAVVRPDGRVELTVGDPHQWLPRHPDRDQLVRRARDLLDR